MLFKANQASLIFLNATRSLSKLVPAEVTLVEVGPRDGLQNEKQNIETERKVEFVNKLSDTGLRRIEVTSFVSPKWVPQLADAKKVMASIKRNPNVRYSTLTPNMKGLKDAIESNTQEIAIFGAASETFTKKNINSTIEQSLRVFDEVVREAKAAKLPIRGYVSCVVGCPYEGYIKPSVVCGVVERMLQMGCYEISLGDTIGVGNAKTVDLLLTELKPVVGNDMSLLAIHCHDTYGMALVNIVKALEHGIRVIDSSCAGLGGCPYAASSASGNVATEDVLYMLNSMGIKTGVDMDKILDASEFIMAGLSRTNTSKIAKALKRKEKNNPKV